jgi:hypothetical protein
VIRTLNCLAAGLVAAVLASALGGVAIGTEGFFTGAYPAGIVNAVAAVLWYAYCGVLFGGVFAVIPGALIMSFSPARRAPWHALLFVVAGTVVGFLAVSLPLANRAAPNGLFAWLMLLSVGPTVGGILAAWLWGRWASHPKRREA